MVLASRSLRLSAIAPAEQLTCIPMWCPWNLLTSRHLPSEMSHRHTSPFSLADRKVPFAPPTAQLVAEMGALASLATHRAVT